MTEGWGDLNGSGPQQIYINVYRESQDWAGNYTTYRIIVRYLAKGYGSWINDAQSWSASSYAVNWSGSFSIPHPGTSDIELLNTTFTVGHNSAGYSGDFNSSASITTNHSSIGSGTVTVTESNIPRIPKRPSPPGTPSFSQILPTSVQVSWGGSGDNGGSGIDSYLLRYWPNSDGSGSYIDHSVENNTSRLVTGLIPGKQYRFVVYAHNGSADNNGYSNPSGAAVVRTLSGAKIKVDGVYRQAIPYIKVDGVYRMVIPYIKVDGVYRMTS